VADTLVTDMGVPDVLVTDTEAKQCSPTDCDLTCSCTDLIPRASISLMVEAGSKVEAGTVVEARTVVEAGTIVEARTVVEAGTTGVEAGSAPSKSEISRSEPPRSEMSRLNSKL
jgi:hypothetical protein